MGSGGTLAELLEDVSVRCAPVTPEQGLDMLAELRDDNLQLVAHMREIHDLCDEHRDVASASLLENWIDEAEGRIWFLYEATRRAEAGA